MPRHLCRNLLLSACLSAASAMVNAALAPEDAVRVTYLYPDIGSPYPGADALLEGGASFLSGFAGIFDISLDRAFITLTLTQNAGVNAVDFDGVRFSDVARTLGFGSWQFDAASTSYAGFDASRLTYDEDTLYVNVVGLPGLAGQTIVLTSAVPEPATAALLLAGVVGVAGVVRCRRVAVVQPG